MPRQRKIRIIAATTSVAFALLVQYFGMQFGTGFYEWWLLPNIVPYLISFGADFALRISPEPVFYGALVLQWAILGVLFGDLYAKYVRPGAS